MSHVRIGLYEILDGSAKEVGELTEEGMLPIFRAQPGFRAYGLAEADGGRLISVSEWESAEQAERANELAAAWVRENLAGRVRLQSAQVGDFLFFASG